jgi:hypothetical protein
MDGEDLLKQFEGFLTASKSDCTSGVSRLDGPAGKCIQANSESTE